MVMRNPAYIFAPISGPQTEAASKLVENGTPQIELENSETEGKEYGFKQTNGYSFNSKGAQGEGQETKAKH